MYLIEKNTQKFFRNIYYYYYTLKLKKVEVGIEVIFRSWRVANSGGQKEIYVSPWKINHSCVHGLCLESGAGAEILNTPFSKTIIFTEYKSQKILDGRAPFTQTQSNFTVITNETHYGQRRAPYSCRARAQAERPNPTATSILNPLLEFWICSEILSM